MSLQKGYKLAENNNSNIYPGNPQGLPDESVQDNVYKSERINNNVRNAHNLCISEHPKVPNKTQGLFDIQVPGMTRKGNAGLPILSKENSVENGKVYKLQYNYNNNMLPGNPKGLPDGSFFKNTLIFIDTGFLSKLSKYFGGGNYLTYDIIKFAENISSEQGLICKKIFYYICPPFQSENPSDEEKKRKDKYDTFIKKLSKNPLFILREGRCQRIKSSNDKFKFCQKGIDTLMTIDLVSIPIKFPDVKKIILIACDSDFVPVIKQLKEFDLEVILYTYFTKSRDTNFSRSSHLINVVSKYVRLTKQDFDNSPLNKEVKDDSK